MTFIYNRINTYKSVQGQALFVKDLLVLMACALKHNGHRRVLQKWIMDQGLLKLELASPHPATNVFNHHSAWINYFARIHWHTRITEYEACFCIAGTFIMYLFIFFSRYGIEEKWNDKVSLVKRTSSRKIWPY